MISWERLMALDCSPGHRPNLSLNLRRFPALILLHIHNERIRGDTMLLNIRGVRKRKPQWLLTQEKCWQCSLQNHEIEYVHVILDLAHWHSLFFLSWSKDAFAYQKKNNNSNSHNCRLIFIPYYLLLKPIEFSQNCLWFFSCFPWMRFNSWPNTIRALCCQKFHSVSTRPGLQAQCAGQATSTHGWHQQCIQPPPD